MEIKRLSVGILGTNCYIVTDNGYACVIDPGADCDRIMSEIKDFKLDKIVLTHGHFDHFMAAEELKRQTGAHIYVSKEDALKLTDYRASLYDIMGIGDAGFISAKADCFLGETVDLCNNTFSVLKTPGHSEGSVCLLCDKMLFSGDTLFRGSIGRYDRGSYDQLMHSLWNLMLLDDDITVLPGHGEATTIGTERNSNPFLM